MSATIPELVAATPFHKSLFLTFLVFAVTIDVTPTPYLEEV